MATNEAFEKWFAENKTRPPLPNLIARIHAERQERRATQMTDEEVTKLLIEPIFKAGQQNTASSTDLLWSYDKEEFRGSIVRDILKVIDEQITQTRAKYTEEDSGFQHSLRGWVGQLKELREYLEKKYDVD